MKNFLLLTALTVMAFAVTGFYPAKKRKLVWADEFNRAGAPDSMRWGYDLGDGCKAPSGLWVG